MDDSQPAFPIDMQCMKITEWLVQRNYVQTDWIHEVKNIQDKTITPLLPSLTHDVLGNIENLHEHVGNTEKCNIPYHICKQVFEYFLSKEGAATDLFGGYSSRSVGSWFNVLKQYRKGALHLGEIGYLITHDLKYELPYWRKQKERTNQQIQATDQKIHSSIRLKDGLSEKYMKTCRGLGLSADSDFSKEEVWNFAIESIIDDGKAKVMELFRSDKFTGLRAVVEFYSKFVQAWQIDTSHQHKTDELLPILNSLLSFLDSRNFELEHIESPPDSHEFGIEIVDEESATCNLSPLPTIDSNIFTPINEHSFHHHFMNELLEIEFFLKQRETEMSQLSLDTFTLTQLMETTPLRQDLESVNETRISEMLTLVKQVKSELNHPQIQQTYKLLRSKPYRFRLQDEILSLKRQRVKICEKIELIEQTKEKSISCLQDISRKIDKILTNCSYLKQLFETEASPLFNDRKVNIVGEINRL